MYFDIGNKTLKSANADYVLIGLYLGCSLGSYFKKIRRRKKKLKKNLDYNYIRGGFETQIGWVDCASDFEVKAIELIVKSKEAKVRIMTFFVNVFALNRRNIKSNLKLLLYFFLNSSVLEINGIHPIVIIMISTVVGLAFSALPLVASLVTPRFILVMFLWRSAKEMIAHLVIELFFRKIYEMLKVYIEYLNEKNLRKKIHSGLFTNREIMPSSNKIKMKLLTRSELQESLQKLKILNQNNVTNAGKLRIDTLDYVPELEKMLEIPKHQFSLKKKSGLKQKLFVLEILSRKPLMLIMCQI